MVLYRRRRPAPIQLSARHTKRQAAGLGAVGPGSAGEQEEPEGPESPASPGTAIAQKEFFAQRESSLVDFCRNVRPTISAFVNSRSTVYNNQSANSNIKNGGSVKLVEFLTYIESDRNKHPGISLFGALLKSAHNPGHCRRCTSASAHRSDKNHSGHFHTADIHRITSISRLSEVTKVTKVTKVYCILHSDTYLYIITDLLK
ncbi:hypothetical protein SLS61_005261 [Didymella pomorum]